MPPLAQSRLSPAVSSRASDSDWRIWSIGRHADISGFCPISFCSTSSSLQSSHSTWLEERSWTQLPLCCVLPMGPSRVKGWGGGRVGVLLSWLGTGFLGPMSYTVHQRRSASQPESQMIPKHSLNPSLSFYFLSFFSFLISLLPIAATRSLLFHYTVTSLSHASADVSCTLFWKIMKETKMMNAILVGAVWVRDQNRAGTRKMFRLGQGACQK